MEMIFYEIGSGVRVVEEVLGTAKHQAGAFQAILYNYVLFFLVRERLEELQAQVDEQTRRVNQLRKEKEKAEQMKTKNAGAEEAQAYKIERDALGELQRAINVLNSKNHQPEIPAWFSGFLRDAMREGMAENGRFQKK